MRTLEQRLKFDHGLPIGQSLIELVHPLGTRRALCEISPRGVVRVLAEPQPDAMYSSWWRVKGDTTSSRECAVIVWGARDPELRQRFQGTPAAVVPVTVPA